MAKDNKDREIKKGDTVTICGTEATVTGKVCEIPHWYDDDGWYIEMLEAKTSGGREVGYSYYKQGYDGGDVIAINGKKC